MDISEMYINLTQHFHAKMTKYCRWQNDAADEA